MQKFGEKPAATQTVDGSIFRLLPRSGLLEIGLFQVLPGYAGTISGTVYPAVKETTMVIQNA
ncbi:MAG: hypothetical protein R6X10_05165 [Desulfobacterales bacterium]